MKMDNSSKENSVGQGLRCVPTFKGGRMVESQKLGRVWGAMMGRLPREEGEVRSKG